MAQCLRIVTVPVTTTGVPPVGVKLSAMRSRTRRAWRSSAMPGRVSFAVSELRLLAIVRPPDAARGVQASAGDRLAGEVGERVDGGEDDLLELRGRELGGERQQQRRDP